MMRCCLFFLFAALCGNYLCAQDTFYVKKKKPAQVANAPRVWTPDSKDSIVSYTVEFRKPGSNVYVVLHEKGPYLLTPMGAYGPTGAVRCIFTEIVAVDPNGRRYRQPDMVRYNGVTVPLKETPK